MMSYQYHAHPGWNEHQLRSHGTHLAIGISTAGRTNKPRCSVNWSTNHMWVWINTYRYIFSGMNIHLPAILGFTRVPRFWLIPIWSHRHHPNVLEVIQEFEACFWISTWKHMQRRAGFECRTSFLVHGGWPRHRTNHQCLSFSPGSLVKMPSFLFRKCPLVCSQVNSLWVVAGEIDVFSWWNHHFQLMIPYQATVFAT